MPPPPASARAPPKGSGAYLVAINWLAGLTLSLPSTTCFDIIMFLSYSMSLVIDRDRWYERSRGVLETGMNSCFALGSAATQCDLRSAAFRACSSEAGGLPESEEAIEETDLGGDKLREQGLAEKTEKWQHKAMGRLR